MLQIPDLLVACDAAERSYAACGQPDAGIQLFLARTCNRAGVQTQVLPGRPALRGEVVQFGDAQDPAVVIVKCAGVRAWADGLQEGIPADLLSALGMVSIRTARDKVGAGLRRLLPEEGEE